MTANRPTFLALVALVFLFVLAGCSGGGRTVPPSAPPAIAPPAATQGAQGAQGAVRGTLSSVLKSYNIDWSNVITAGISSGAYMATQLHVAHSRTFRGAAIFAGGPYYCAQDNFYTALNACSNNIWYDNVPALEQDTINTAFYGYIDPVSNLSGQKAYLFSGTSDTTVYPSVVRDLKSYYQYFGMNVTTNFTTNAGHGWISPDVTQACNSTASPYINNCGFDAENTFLQLFFGTLNPRNNGAAQGSLIQFSQNEFTPGGYAPSWSMDQNGYVYVPTTCASGQTCKLVVALHGCKQGAAYVGTTFVAKSGLNEWADTNHIIVLYPQAIPSYGSPYNPNGCWDWWGYDGTDYAAQSGVQTNAIYAMVNRL